MNTAGQTKIPKKCGIRFTPPALVLVYEDISKQNKLRKYVMPVRNFRTSSSVSFVAQQLKQRHEKMLGSVSIIQVEKMLRILQEHLKGTDINEAVELANKEFTVNPDEDLNKLGDDEIKKKKEIMDETFNKNRIKPGDPDFVYDKRVDFEKELKEKVESGWDKEENDDLFWN